MSAHFLSFVSYDTILLLPWGVVNGAGKGIIILWGVILVWGLAMLWQS